MLSEEKLIAFPISFINFHMVMVTKRAVWDNVEFTAGTRATYADTNISNWEPKNNSSCYIKARSFSGETTRLQWFAIGY